ncbi:unnamed protein product [Cladocopium goreaui]|uniref:Uncharacterized protein n=1 Tax=Cladocopium goreaui TaxID=2562237 RepID=A0A9P1CJN6_9DINO|nr:unnamed protein product [Cladocopium goreaui]
MHVIILIGRTAVIFLAGKTDSRRSLCFAAFHSNSVTRAASSWFGGLLISLSLRGKRWKTNTKVCAGKERYSNLPDEIMKAVSNQIYGVVDSNSDADLYHKVLSFISVNGVGESWEIRQSANPTGAELTAQPGLGWHLSDWKGQKIRSLHFEQGQRKVAIFIEGGDKEELLHFFRSCKKHGQDEQDAMQVPRPKFWVQELVEAALREGEETEKDESDSTEDARWSELKKDEADKLGAKRLGTCSYFDTTSCMETSWQWPVV